MKGSDVRTNGDCVGTRYGGMMRDIYRKRGKQGERMVYRASSKAEASGTGLGNRSRERTLTVPPPYGQTHEAISEI
jgi:hypothetical protein